ncbi:MAG: M50 family metallopeptidase, partial [Candidatus Omnitrophota bacterium]
MFSKAAKGVTGVLLIPALIGVSKSFFEILTGMGGTSGVGSKKFLMGALAYVIMHLFIVKPNYIYVFGHEMMHAVATFLCGGRVNSFRASKEGGAVETTKTNAFITLSPYFVPTYTLLFSILYIVLPLFIK